MASNSISSDILAANTDINLKDVDLNNCDREPIHIPNLIQPHGVLLVVAEENYQIVQVSLNTDEMLGIEPKKLLNKPLRELLGKEQITAVQRCLSEDFNHVNPLPIKIDRDGSNLNFDGIVHRNGEIVIVELEPSAPSQEVDFFNFYKLVKSPVNKIQNTRTLDEQ